MKDDALEVKLTQIQEDVGLIKSILLGDNDPSSGIVVRMDRLEVEATRRHWFTTTALAALITTFVGFLIKFFSNHH